MKLRANHLVATAAAALIFGAVTVRTFAAPEVAKPAAAPEDNLLRFVTRFSYVTSSCSLVFQVPLTRSLIVQSISNYIFRESNSGGEFDFYTDSGCSNLFAATLATAATTEVDKSFGTGLAIGQGQGLYVKGGSTAGSITMTGYLIQSSAANIDGPIRSTNSLAHSGANPLFP